MGRIYKCSKCSNVVLISKVLQKKLQLGKRKRVVCHECRCVMKEQKRQWNVKQQV